MVLVQAILAAIFRSAVLTAALEGNRRSAARTSPADLPAPDAHSEARLPKAA
jgi:hypothetical protein